MRFIDVVYVRIFQRRIEICKNNIALPASYPSPSTWNLLACSCHVKGPKRALHYLLGLKIYEPARSDDIIKLGKKH